MPTPHTPPPKPQPRPPQPPHRPPPSDKPKPTVHAPVQQLGEHGGPKGLEPTRFGDWEQNGRCSDF